MNTDADPGAPPAAPTADRSAAAAALDPLAGVRLVSVTDLAEAASVCARTIRRALDGAGDDAPDPVRLTPAIVRYEAGAAAAWLRGWIDAGKARPQTRRPHLARGPRC